MNKILVAVLVFGVFMTVGARPNSNVRTPVLKTSVAINTNS